MTMMINKLTDWSGFSYHINMEFKVTGGENYTIINIVEHKPESKNDKWYYDVFFSNYKVRRIFEFKEIDYG